MTVFEAFEVIDNRINGLMDFICTFILLNYHIGFGISSSNRPYKINKSLKLIHKFMNEIAHHESYFI